MFCFILTRKELINGFNLLLVGLAAFDSCYIFGAVMESEISPSLCGSDGSVALLRYVPRISF